MGTDLRNCRRSSPPTAYALDRAFLTESHPSSVPNIPKYPDHLEHLLWAKHSFDTQNYRPLIPPSALVGSLDKRYWKSHPVHNEQQPSMETSFSNLVTRNVGFFITLCCS